MMKNHSIPADVQLIYRATNLAAKLHKHQRRKDGVTPYISHLQRVALHLRHTFGCGDAAALAAGILHDAIEDTTADFDEVAAATSQEVASLVACLTKDMRMPEPEREAAYDRQLWEAPWQAKLVKIADVYDNICDSILSNTPTNIGEKLRRALELAATDDRLSGAADRLRELGGPLAGQGGRTSADIRPGDSAGKAG